MRPSRLYRYLEWPGPGPLLEVTAGDQVLDDDQVHSISIRRGNGQLAGYSPATITVETPTNLDPVNTEALSSVALDVRLTDAAATYLADRVNTPGTVSGTTPADLQWRFRGRVGRQSARDSGRGRRGTIITGAAWSSILARLSVDQYGYTPEVGMKLSHAAAVLFQPAWEPRCGFSWIDETSSLTSDAWAPPDTGTLQPINPSGLISILTQRLHGVSDVRTGELRVTVLSGAELRASRAASTWPIARSQVVDDGTTWEQPSAFSTIHQVTVRRADDTLFTNTIGPPPGSHIIETHDWSDFRALTEQWHRLRGVQWAESQTSWHLSSIKIRVDQLLRSSSDYDRGVAGDVLRLNVGDAVGLAGDWPELVDGVHFVTSLDETISHDEWTITISLTPYSALAGEPSIPVKPVTWAQTRDVTWSDVPTSDTWETGLSPIV